MRWSDAELDEVIEEVIVDAYDDSEQLTSMWRSPTSRGGRPAWLRPIGDGG